jgi:K+-sensing histidine kinase KdpD
VHGHARCQDFTQKPWLEARLGMFASGANEPTLGQRRRYGLGLSLVSDIAARHGGSVSARNAEGGGAVLRLLLPRERS